MTHIVILKNTENGYLIFTTSSDVDETILEYSYKDLANDVAFSLETRFAGLLNTYIKKKLYAFQVDDHYFMANLEDAMHHIIEANKLLNLSREDDEIAEIRNSIDLLPARNPTHEERNIIDKLKEIQSEIYCLKLIEKQYKNQIMIKIGKNSGLGDLITFHGFTRKKFDIQRFSEDYPDLVDQYTEQMPTRRLVVK